MYLSFTAWRVTTGARVYVMGVLCVMQGPAYPPVGIWTELTSTSTRCSSPAWMTQMK